MMTSHLSLQGQRKRFIMSGTSRRGADRASRLARAAALSGTSGKVCPADRATLLLEAIIEPGDPVANEGDNQKQADFLTRDPAKIRNENVLMAIAAVYEPYQVRRLNHGIGLRGVSFGNFLIKQVVEELQAEFPQLKQFSTLSPVPGFRRWLMQRLAEGSDPDAALLPQLESGCWWNDPAQSEKLHAPLLRLCARYLTRRPSIRIDPVARFHLGNGAQLERINWFGNNAPRGIQESFGIM